MVELVQKLAEGWIYEAVSIGYPGLVGNQGPSSEPGNLGDGWVGFDFHSAFGLPVRIMNDAAMQALGSYEGGRMLFLGLGTGLGSALITEETILTLELGHLPYKRGGTLGETLGRQGLKRLGKAAWRRAVMDVTPSLMKAFLADSVVIGGGNAKKLNKLPPGVRLGHNLTAFRGGFRLWSIEKVQRLCRAHLQSKIVLCPCCVRRRRANQSIVRRGAPASLQLSWPKLIEPRRNASLTPLLPYDRLSSPELFWLVCLFPTRSSYHRRTFY
jgi:hypothetical protein